jgi:hypothetical protein
LSAFGFFLSLFPFWAFDMAILRFVQLTRHSSTVSEQNFNRNIVAKGDALVALALDRLPQHGHGMQASRWSQSESRMPEIGTSGS